MSNGTTPSVISTDNPMVDQFYDNTQSNIIRITDDKLNVILLENKEAIEKRSNFLTPLTLLITLVLTFCTNDFKDFLMIPKDAWQGFYMFCILGSAIWLIIEIRKKKKVISVKELVERIRAQNQNKDAEETTTNRVDGSDSN